MTDAQLAFFREALRDQAEVIPLNSYELEVDGILSFRPTHTGVYVRQFYSILRDGHDGPCWEKWDQSCLSAGHAFLRCSRPHTPDDERRWLAGEKDEDLDAWNDY